MKGLFPPLLIMLLSINCFAQKLKIVVYNKTGYTLDSVSMGTEIPSKINPSILDSAYGSIYIGTIPKDSSRVVLNLDGIELQDGFPFMFEPDGIIRHKNKHKDTILARGHCGTGVHWVNAGYYEFDITEREDNYGEYSLGWYYHSKKQ